MLTHARFKEIRFENNLSQKQFGEVLGLKARQVTEIERDNKKTTVEYAVIIEDKYGVNMRWLLTGRGDKYLKNTPKVGEDDFIINRNDYVGFEDIKELLVLLKDVPKSWTKKIIIRLEEQLKDI